MVKLFLARFIPLHVLLHLAAGSSNMSYGKFLIYNVAGAIFGSVSS
jgi:membrane-associated protein